MSRASRGLALRLEGPLQSWGLRPQGDTIPTADVPTRSGVVGLLGAALGVQRGDGAALDVIRASFRLVVRVDRAGHRAEDFHTVACFPAPEGARVKDRLITRRWYLHDASFVALLVEEREGTLGALLEAIRDPFWAPYLGRRSCVPSEPLLALPRLLSGPWDAMLAEVPRATRSTGVSVQVCNALLGGSVPEGYRILRVEQQVDPYARDPVTWLRRQDPVLPGPTDTVTAWMPEATDASLGVGPRTTQGAEDSADDFDTTKGWMP